MKTKLTYIFTIITAGFLLGGCTLPFINKTSSLQVLSSPRATVMLNDKIVGETPYFNAKIKAGQYSLKLIPIGQLDNILPYETKLELKKDLKTAVNWNFRSTEASSSGYIMTQEPVSDKKNAVLMVVSDPSGATVKLDGQIVGTTPFQKGGLTPKQYKIEISSPGYITEEITANVEAGYKLIVNFKLGQGTSATLEDITSPEASPSPTPTPKKVIKVKKTPTGWLRVRSKPGLTGKELAKVNPGDQFEVLDEQKGWYQIEYEKDKKGWVSGTYVTVVKGETDEKTTPTPAPKAKNTPTAKPTKSPTTTPEATPTSQ
ncbi:MAG: PEGA domain-containing protein [bacterium]|nr:PEGA domain-containing protein [bacterium]